MFIFAYLSGIVMGGLIVFVTLVATGKIELKYKSNIDEDVV